MPMFQLPFCSHHQGKKDKDNQKKFLKIENSNNIFTIFLFCFIYLFCPDDDCRKAVETSAYLLLSILSGDNDLL